MIFVIERRKSPASSALSAITIVQAVDDTLAPLNVCGLGSRSKPLGETFSRWVPKSSIVTTAERTVVVRNRDGRAEWVDVKKGVAEGVEVTGNLKPGDMVVRRATDEMRDGTPLDR